MRAYANIAPDLEYDNAYNSNDEIWSEVHWGREVTINSFSYHVIHTYLEPESYYKHTMLRTLKSCNMFKNIVYSIEKNYST